MNEKDLAETCKHGIPFRYECDKCAAPMQSSTPDDDKVICPNCIHQFRAIPPNVQCLMLDAGFEPPFTAAPTQAGGKQPVALREVGLTRDTNGMCVVTVNGREVIRDNGDIISHYATLDWFDGIGSDA